MLHRCIEGEKVGVDGSKIVDVDRCHDPSPAALRRHRDIGGESPPPSSSSLASPLDGTRVPPLVHGLHGAGGVGAPLRLDLPLCSLLFRIFYFLAKKRFLYSRIHNSDCTEILA